MLGETSGTEVDGNRASGDLVNYLEVIERCQGADFVSPQQIEVLRVKRQHSSGGRFSFFHATLSNQHAEAAPTNGAPRKCSTTQLSNSSECHPTGIPDKDSPA